MRAAGPGLMVAPLPGPGARTKGSAVRIQSKANADRKERGQSMVEFALVLPLFLIVMFIIADFGVGFSRWLVITNSAREGARLATVGTTVDEVKERTAATSNGLLGTSDVTVTYEDIDTLDDDGGYPGNAGDAVTVSAEYTYNLITPMGKLLNLTFGSILLSSCSDMRLETDVEEDVSGMRGSGCGS